MEKEEGEGGEEMEERREEEGGGTEKIFSISTIACF